MRLPILERPILYVNESFLHNKKPAQVHPTEIAYSGEGEIIRLGALANALSQVIRDNDEDRTKSDGPLSVELHQTLHLTRREAAQMAFWHFLSIIESPEYVAWRYFDPLKKRTNRERYVGLLDDNAFARLWWWAELTRDDDNSDPYHQTRKGAQNLELVKSVVENLFGGNRVLVSSLIDLVCSSPNRMADQQVKQITMRINALLVTVAVDLLPDSVVQQIPHEIASTF